MFKLKFRFKSKFKCKFRFKFKCKFRFKFKCKFKERVFMSMHKKSWPDLMMKFSLSLFENRGSFDGDIKLQT